MTLAAATGTGSRWQLKSRGGPHCLSCPLHETGSRPLQCDRGLNEAFWDIAPPPPTTAPFPVRQGDCPVLSPAAALLPSARLGDVPSDLRPDGRSSIREAVTRGAGRQTRGWPLRPSSNLPSPKRVFDPLLQSPPGRSLVDDRRVAGCPTGRSSGPSFRPPAARQSGRGDRYPTAPVVQPPARSST